MASKASKGFKRIELVDAIDGASRALSANMVMFHQKIASLMGLNATEHKCADILSRSGPVTAGQLAQLTGLTTGAITGIVDRLEKAGFVRRANDPNDRRRVIIHPSLPAEKVDYLKDLFQSLNESLRREVSGYSDRELGVILDFLERCNTMMHEETHKLRDAAKLAAKPAAKPPGKPPGKPGGKPATKPITKRAATKGSAKKK
jgi:DNA-binding MarR family transcriptional regulator